MTPEELKNGSFVISAEYPSRSSWPSRDSLGYEGENTFLRPISPQWGSREATNSGHLWILASRRRVVPSNDLMPLDFYKDPDIPLLASGHCRLDCKSQQMLAAVFGASVFNFKPREDTKTLSHPSMALSSQTDRPLATKPVLANDSALVNGLVVPSTKSTNTSEAKQLLESMRLQDHSSARVGNESMGSSTLVSSSLLAHPKPPGCDHIQCGQVIYGRLGPRLLTTSSQTDQGIDCIVVVVKISKDGQNAVVCRVREFPPSHIDPTRIRRATLYEQLNKSNNEHSTTMIPLCRARDAVPPCGPFFRLEVGADLPFSPQSFIRTDTFHDAKIGDLLKLSIVSARLNGTRLDETSRKNLAGLFEFFVATEAIDMDNPTHKELKQQYGTRGW
jgi:hypothetical protein